MPSTVVHNCGRGSFFAIPLCTLRISWRQYIIDNLSEFVYNLCMMLVMVKEAELNRIEVPEDYEILDATALDRRLGFKRDTVLAYLSRRNFRRIPRPIRLLTMGPIWYEKNVREWEAKEVASARGR
jgi:predicted DNA-binding transcriptional regulator AlpA